MSREFYTRVTLTQNQYNQLRQQANTASSLSKQVQAQQSLNNSLQQQNDELKKQNEELKKQLQAKA